MPVTTCMQFKFTTVSLKINIRVLLIETEGPRDEGLIHSMHHREDSNADDLTPKRRLFDHSLILLHLILGGSCFSTAHFSVGMLLCSEAQTMSIARLLNILYFMDPF